MLLCLIGSALRLLGLKGGDRVFEITSMPPHELTAVTMEFVDPTDNRTDLVRRDARGRSRVNGFVHAAYEPLLLAQHPQDRLRVRRSLSAVLEALYEYVIELGEIIEDTGDVSRRNWKLFALGTGSAIIGQAAV